MWDVHDLTSDATVETRVRAIIVPTSSGAHVLLGDGANEWVHILSHLVQGATVGDAVTAANNETPATAAKYMVLGNHGITLKSR